jgi:hypothetical protein
VIDIKAFQRRRNIQRQFQVQCVQRYAVGPEFRRGGTQQESKGQGNEATGSQAAGKLQTQQRRQVGRERDDQRDQRKGRRRRQQNSAGAINTAKPDGDRRDKHLADALGGRDPCAFVVAGVHGATDICQAKSRQPAIERRDEGAQQYRRHAHPGDG